MLIRFTILAFLCHLHNFYYANKTDRKKRLNWFRLGQFFNTTKSKSIIVSSINLACVRILIKYKNKINNDTK